MTFIETVFSRISDWLLKPRYDDLGYVQSRIERLVFMRNDYACGASAKHPR